MKKIVICIILSILMSLQLISCGWKGNEIKNYDISEKEGLTPKDNLDVSTISALERKDNSLDIYSAIINAPLQMENPEGALPASGKSAQILGNSIAICLKKHLFEDSSQCWDELEVMTMEGIKRTERLDWAVNWDWNNQIWNMGAVLGTDCYITYHINVLEDTEHQYSNYLLKNNENGEVLCEIPLTFMDGEELNYANSIMADTAGYVHLIDDVEEELHYYIASSEGELLVDYKPEGYWVTRLVPLYDGRVAFEVQKDYKEGEKREENRRILQYLDMESGEVVTLAELVETFSNTYYNFTLLDENTLLYANAAGIYRSDLSGNHPELLYLWSNHGISVSGVRAMQQVEGNRIALIYESSGDMNYLCIEPTTEEVEIQEITMAVAPYMKSTYQTVVTEFNKRYPSCHIELKSDYEDTALLTELIAGEGPVLIDTTLTGFDNQEKLWEPLDAVFEGLGITEELQPSVMELGKIDGTLYGIVTDFYLETVVVGEKNLKEWDYDTFLKCIQENPDLEAVMNSNDGKDGWYFISNFLIHGLEDNYLLDAEKCTTNFDSREFRAVLEVAKKYCERDDYVYPGSSLLEGEVLCNALTIQRPEQIALYRICYGEDINYIGYPSEEGSKHYLNGRSPIAIRRTATKEEKEIACAFISLLLSYDCQSKMSKGVNFSLSVRKDVLEEQINSVNENSMPYASGFEQIKLGDRVDNVQDAGTMYDLIDKAIPRKYFPRELNSILSDELSQYFSGTITEKILIDHLENRVGLYLEERQ